MIPLHLSGFAIAGIFVMMACVAVPIMWEVCVIADEWRDAEWHADENEPEKAE